MTDLLITQARLVAVGGAPASAGPVDVRVHAGRVTALAPSLPTQCVADIVAAQGRWLMPGLWDAHVHPVMWGLARARLDLAGTIDPTDVCRRVATHLSAHPGVGLVLGYGYRSAVWDRPPTVAELDAVTGRRPVALASGDAHNGWLNSAALALIGLPPRPGAVVEEEWFAAYRRLEPVAAQSENPEAALDAALHAAAERGVVGIVDFEFGSAWLAWRERLGRGRPPIRVRAATYPDALDAVAAQGLATGDLLLPEEGRVTMGPLKVISDGSLNTLTAWCHQPYASDQNSHSACGTPNLALDALCAVMARAKDLGLTAAIHAIGDRAVTQALDAFVATGQRGSIEHAQLVGAEDFTRFGGLGLTASVQPVHLLDDRAVSDRYWGDRADRVYAFRSLITAGVSLALGSDAPVAPLDPWLAIAAAVTRAAGADDAWHGDQCLTLAEALAASTDGRGTVAPGSPADLLLLEADPYAADAMHPTQAAAYLRGMPVAVTMVAGEVVAGARHLG